MKTVLITGASSGIGRETALLFQKNGWNVAASMRTPEKEKRLGGLQNVMLVKMDVTDVESIKTGVQEVIAVFGGLDVVINNAGVGSKGLFEAASPDDIRWQFDVNLFGIINVMREVLPYFRNKKAGLFVNISSQAGFLGVPLNSLYNSSKFAVEGLTESLMYELATINIGVKVVELSAVNSGFLGSTRFMEAPGLGDYELINRTVMPRMKEYLGNGISPAEAARTVFRAATDGTRRLRYLAGKGIGLSYRLKKFAPNSMAFRIVRRRFALA